MSRSSDVEGTLSIRNVRISDTGRYVCTGSNMFSTDRAAAYLRVIPGLYEYISILRLWLRVCKITAGRSWTRLNFLFHNVPIF